MIGAAFAHPRYPSVPGIVGGLGPSAHLAFERRLLGACADDDGDAGHLPWVLVSLPHTPDRSEALAHGGRDPFPFLVAALHRLAAAGADFAVIPCNTAHAWLDRITPLAPLPVLDIRDSLTACLRARPEAGEVGVLATDGTLASGVLAAPAARAGCTLRAPDPDDQARVMAVIRVIKRRSDPATLDAARESLAAVARRLARRGARVQLVACSELSLVACCGSSPLACSEPSGVEPPVWIDTMALLAEATLRAPRQPAGPVCDVPAR